MTTLASAADSPTGPLFHSPLGLFPFQVDDIAEAYLRTEPGQEQGLAVLWSTGLGKAQAVTEPVLTPRGWRPIGEIRRGDYVVGSNGTPTRVTSVHPQGIRPLYRVTFSDGSSTICDEQHLWTVRYWGSDRSSGQREGVLRTRTLSLAEMMAKGIKTPAGRRRFSIPMTAPVQYAPVELPIPAYQLGAILGDGHIRLNGNLRLSTDKEIIDAFALPGESTMRKGCFVKATMKYASELVELGLAGRHSHDKFVPREYLHAPEADRRALLAGLLDTDGSPIEVGGAEFTSTSEALIEAVCELVESLGGVAKRSGSRVTRYTHNGEVREGRPSWRVNVKLNEQPFRLARKMIGWRKPTKYPAARWFESIERVEDGEAVCIKVAAVDELYLTRHHIVTHNTVFGMALASLLVEDEAVDLVLVAAERNKVVDWRDDFARFTKLDTHLYHGSGRQRRLSKSGMPHVLVSTYETLSRDLTALVDVPGRKSKKLVDGPLMDTLDLRGKRVMVIFDEVTALKSRGSQRHKAFAYLLGELRKTGHVRAFGLTATPAEADIEDAYNIGRILFPDAMPTVAVFEEDYTKGRDPYGRYSYRPHARDQFGKVFQQHALIKHKTDPDVIAQFPQKVEKAIHVELDPAHRKFYDAVAEMVTPDYGSPMAQQQEQLAFTVLRMTAGHPASHLYAQNDASRTIVETLGEDALRAIPSSKSTELITRLKPVVKGQGAQAIIFTFYGQSVLRALGDDLRTAGFGVVEYHGGNSVAANEQAKNTFLGGGAEILLASDAAARGLNLQNAQYVFEYESALTFALREQRINRVHRIGSGHPSVTCYTLIVQDTVEDGIMHKVLTRNKDHDALTTEGGEENYVSAADRRAILGF